MFNLYCLLFLFFCYELSVFISFGPFHLCESHLSYHTAGKEGKLSFCSSSPSDSLDPSHQQVSGKPPGGYSVPVSSLSSVEFWCRWCPQVTSSVINLILSKNLTAERVTTIEDSVESARGEFQLFSLCLNHVWIVYFRAEPSSHSRWYGLSSRSNFLPEWQ